MDRLLEHGGGQGELATTGDDNVDLGSPIHLSDGEVVIDMLNAANNFHSLQHLRERVIALAFARVRVVRALIREKRDIGKAED